jgi:uncharacterized protein YdbL (DUF1318 family)
MKQFFKILCWLGLSLMIALPAMAMDLQTAKAKGLVGETPAGYLAAVGNQPADVQQLVQSINEKRRAHYQKIAAGNNTDLKTVEQLAGKKAIDKSGPGHFVQVGGQWKKK